MKYKYVEEEYPNWFVNGDLILAFNNKREKDISIKGLTKEEVDALIAEHNLVVEKLCEIACAWAESDHEAFTKYWYPTQ